MTFDDHGSRWGTVARNLDITVTKFAGYRGEANFHGGTVWIQDYVPMSMSMKSVFRVEEGIVRFERMTLLTDGAESNITGDADIKNWPEMTYKVKSTVDFKRMRELFFAKDNYTLVRRRTLQRNLPSLQGRPRAHGRLRERPRGAADWRP